MMATPHSRDDLKYRIDSHLNPTLSTRVILNHIWQVKQKWRTLGQKLGIENEKLRRIDAEQPGLENRLMEMIQYWLKSDSQCTWEKLIEALISMGERARAQDIKRKVENGHIESNKREAQWLVTDDVESYFEEIRTIKTEIEMATARKETEIIKDEIQHVQRFFSTAKSLLKKIQENTQPLRLAALAEVVKESREVKKLRQCKNDEKEQIHILVQDATMAHAVTEYQDRLKTHREEIKTMSNDVEKWEQEVLKRADQKVQGILFECVELAISYLKQQPHRFHSMHEGQTKQSDQLKTERAELEEPIALLEAKFNRRYMLPMYYAAKGFDYGFYNSMKVFWGAQGAIFGCLKAVWGGTAKERTKLNDLQTRKSRITEELSDCEVYMKECLELSAECEKYCTIIDTAKSFLVLE